MVKRFLARVLSLIYDGFDAAFETVNWAFFLTGFFGFFLTVTGVLPPFGDGFYGKMLACLLFAEVAKDGYSDLERAT